MHLLDLDHNSDRHNPQWLYVGKIFIVDDTKANLTFLARLLETEGHKVQVFQDSLLALKTAIANPPDLIISDIRMPEMDGYEFCYHLKSNSHTQHIPFIFISVLDSFSEKAKAFDAGAIDYFTKPFDAKEVLLRIRNHMRIQSLYLQVIEQNQALQAEISLRKAGEEKARLAEEKFTKAFYSSPNPATITLLKDGTHLEVNDSFCLATGYSAQEILGRTTMELNLWVNLEAREQLFQLIRTHHKVQNHEFEFRTKYGRIRTAILSCEIIEIEGQECLLSLSNDITDRKRAESRLKVANSALQKLADLDGLTMIANRRRFDAYLKYHWEEVQKKGGYLSLFLGDVDHFKVYNDCYGHLQGDQCLIQLAQILRHGLAGKTELVARYGGEEFALILPERSPDSAKVIIQQILQILRDKQMPHHKSPVAPFVTMSFGGYTLDAAQKICTPRQMIAWADEALYQAKNQGRNCIVCKSDVLNELNYAPRD